MYESKASPSTPGGNGPRGPPPINIPNEAIPEAGYGLVGAALTLKGTPSKFNSMAAPKLSSSNLAAATPLKKAQKDGAIQMFDSPAPVPNAPAEAKDGFAANSKFAPGPKMREPRPLAPSGGVPGVPAGQPPPPDSRPPAVKAPPAPLRPPPSRGRLPPEEEPPDAVRKKPRPAAPVETPPFVRNYKDPDAAPVKIPRRERENPEFEASSEEDEAEDRERKHVAASRSFAPGPPMAVTSEAAPPIPSVAAQTFAPGPPLEDSVASVSPRGFAPAPAAAVSKPEREKVPVLVTEEGDKRSLGKALNFAKPELMGKMTARSDARSEVSTVSRAAVSNTHDSALVPRPQTRGPLEVLGEPEFKGGRFSIRCIEGIDISRPYSTASRLDPFIKFKLGAADRLPWKETQIKRKQDSNPNFENELVAFDIVETSLYLHNNDILLYAELWNNSTTKDEIIATFVMSVTRIVQHPYITYRETVPLQIHSGKPYSGKLVLEFSYEEARPGMLVFTLFEGRGLRSLDALDHQDPYVEISIGDVYSKRSAAVKGGGKAPYFEEEEVVMWVDTAIWVNDVVVAVCDEQIGPVQPIGTVRLSALTYMSIPPGKAVREEFDLSYQEMGTKGGVSALQKGELGMKVTFLPAGNLVVKCIKAKDLAPPPSKDVGRGSTVRMDPYLTLTMEGQAAKIVKRSTTDKDGGSDPVWDCDIQFDVVDQYFVDVEVFDQDLSGEDVLLGTTQLSLLPVFKAGQMNLWSTLRLRREGIGVKETGNVNFQLSFSGPTGIAYPQHRSDVDSFDDTLRSAVEKKMEENEDEAPVPVSAAEAIMNQLSEIKEPPAEFSEDEIVAAFRFIDLDHNNFVGAAEIRHILVCMGELVTDEEIDMMITMVDGDGDGQISYKEFRTMVLHPNPGESSLQDQVDDIRLKAAKQDAAVMKGRAKDMDAVAYQRQKDMMLRESKKRMLNTFIEDNDTIFDNVTKTFSLFENLSKEKRIGGRVNFETFCVLMKVEPIGEYIQLFKLFDPEEHGSVDIREFLLSMMNFLNVEKEQRVRFSFQMYDETKSGYISQKEVEEILRGNHMMSLEAVQRKAQTVMKQASANAAGAITLQEFIVVSKKFPNIILPTFNQSLD